MASGWISITQRIRIYTRDNSVCCYCGKTCVSNHAYQNSNGAIDRSNVNSLDHIVSQKELAAASTDDKDFSAKRRDAKNLVVACTGCNAAKKDIPLYVWCQQTNKDYARIIIEIGNRIQRSL